MFFFPWYPDILKLSPTRVPPASWLTLASETGKPQLPMKGWMDAPFVGQSTPWENNASVWKCLYIWSQVRSVRPKNSSLKRQVVPLPRTRRPWFTPITGPWNPDELEGEEGHNEERRMRTAPPCSALAPCFCPDVIHAVWRRNMFCTTC